jgi:PiT family inorganic phosphate transporter
MCHVAIALGTMAGGWRVIETLGMKMTKLKPVLLNKSLLPLVFPV